MAFTGLAIVLHYTCGFTAQPPGTRGYSHEHRLMAPIVALREVRGWGIGNNELRKIRDGGTIQGFMYLPQIGAVQLDSSEVAEDEWTGHAAALIYRPASVSQALLDQVARFRGIVVPNARLFRSDSGRGPPVVSAACATGRSPNVRGLHRIVLGLFVMAAAGCGGDGDEPSSETPRTQATATPAKERSPREDAELEIRKAANAYLEAFAAKDWAGVCETLVPSEQ